jgi:hypothetical protein
MEFEVLFDPEDVSQLVRCEPLGKKSTILMAAASDKIGVQSGKFRTETVGTT